MANEIQRVILTLHNNNVTQFTVKHSSYTNATTGYLIMTNHDLLVNIMLAFSPIPRQIIHMLFDIISYRVDTV